MTQNLEYMEKELIARKRLRTIIADCVKDMKEAGIPIQDKRIVGIGIQKLAGTRAACYFTMAEDGLDVFYIYIHEKIINHLNDEAVWANVKNSIYHELLHTCDDCREHNHHWMKWSKVCDDKLGTHTRRHIEEKLYYNPSLKPIVYHCNGCGNEYWATSKLSDNNCDCELCANDMIRFPR